MYLSTVGILVIAAILFVLLIMFMPMLYGPYLNLLDARDALEDQTESQAGDQAVERLERRVDEEWSRGQDAVREAAAKARTSTRADAQKRIDDAKAAVQAKAAAEEAELSKSLDAAREKLSDDVEALTKQLVGLAIGRNI